MPKGRSDGVWALGAAVGPAVLAHRGGPLAEGGCQGRQGKSTDEAHLGAPHAPKSPGACARARACLRLPVLLERWPRPLARVGEGGAEWVGGAEQAQHRLDARGVG